MTHASKPRNLCNARTSIVINGGVSRQVVVPFCPYCGRDLKGVECSTILTRFTCPDCGTSIANTKENRCKECGVMCSSSEDLNVHMTGGCGI